MRKLFFVVLCFLFVQLSTAQSEFKFVTPDKKTAYMTYKGHYTGKNVFLKNQFATKGAYGFCIHEVKINGEISIAELNSEIFEVALDLPGMNFKIGDDITIQIKYVLENMPRVTPTILTPGALLNEENFKNPKEDRFVVEGRFYGGELYVTNYFNSATKTYGIKQIIVNGKPFAVKLDRDMVAINLFTIVERTDENGKLIPGLKEADVVKIELVCEKGANPTFLNLDLITPISN
jgi:hypothetical protein